MCSREILPLSIPETVVGLIPDSSANRPCVHIRVSRNYPALYLASVYHSLSSLLPAPYHKCVKKELLQRKCVSIMFRTCSSGYNNGIVREGGPGEGARRRGGEEDDDESL